MIADLICHRLNALMPHGTPFLFGDKNGGKNA